VLGGVTRAIWVLQAAVGFVLLIACANLANLLLARAETRHREFAVRTAIGATRGRLLRQFMTESVLLAFAGGLLGLILARIGVQALLRAYPNSLPRTAEVTVDPAVLVFTFAVATISGLLFGLAPILHTRPKGLVTALKEGGDRGATGAARHYVRRSLVMAEVALAVMLVIGAGLLLRTVYNLTTVDAGFDRSRLVTFSLTLPRVNYQEAGCSSGCAPFRECRPRAPCPDCRRTAPSMPTIPTSTTTLRRRKGRTKTSTTTRTCWPAISRPWAFRSCMAAASSQPTPRQRAW
jgi:putative ABC transport system permease protein